MRRAKVTAIDRGIAVEQSDGLLVFEDPGRWPAILSPGLRLVEPCDDSAGADDPTDDIDDSAGADDPTDDIDDSAGADDPTDDIDDAADDSETVHDGTHAANDGLFSIRPRDIVSAVGQRLAPSGWHLPADPLVPEILAAAFDRWGPAATLDWLLDGLAGPNPSHALEPIGAALGERFECPYQLIRGSPDPRT